MMQVFHGTVRLAGDMKNEVYKRGLTVPEIYILRKIHGGEDAVVKLESAGLSDIDDDDERNRLSFLYNQGLSAISGEDATSVKQMFGEYGSLPTVLKGFTGELNETVDDLDKFQESLPYKSPDPIVTAAEKRKARDAAKSQGAPLPASPAAKLKAQVKTGKDKALEAIM